MKCDSRLTTLFRNARNKYQIVRRLSTKLKKVSEFMTAELGSPSCSGLRLYSHTFLRNVKSRCIITTCRNSWLTSKYFPIHPKHRNFKNYFVFIYGTMSWKRTDCYKSFRTLSLLQTEVCIQTLQKYYPHFWNAPHVIRKSEYSSNGSFSHSDSKQSISSYFIM
jgi:hypothetical protein